MWDWGWLEQKAEAELGKLKMMSPMSAEASVVRSYIDWMVSVPWAKRSKVKHDLKRDFYYEMCRLEKWSTRKLQKQIDAMLYERTVISGQPDETVKAALADANASAPMSPDLVFKSPYFLDFLGLTNTFSEHDLESAILAEMQRFLCELGSHFAFIASQKQLVIDGTE